MTPSAVPGVGASRGLERGLIWTVAVSAAAHGGLLIAALSLPGRFLTVPQRLESYSVDLVAPEVIGGTNLVAGTAPKPAPPPPPAPAAAEAAAPKPPPVAEPASPAEPKPPPPAPVKAAPVAKAPEPPPPPAKAAQPKVAEPKVAEAKTAQLKVAEPAPKVVAKKAEPPPPAAKPVQPAPAKPAAVEKAAPAKPEKEAVAAKPATAAKPAPVLAAKPDPRTAAATEQDRAITAAVQRRAEQVKDASSNLDQRIAAAVQRRAAQLATAKETAPAGAVVGSGPGTNAGGTPADLQYILYEGKMKERIKAAWAWAGADRTLHAVVQFNITPEGDVRNVRTIASSGDITFDASVERAVRAADPLDPVPEKYRAAFATVELTFRASDLES